MRNMKDEHIPTRDAIWTNNVELLTHDECFPIIGSCQVSSILQNLDTNEQETNPQQNMDLIILPSDIKLPTVENVYNCQKNYIILKDNGSKNDTMQENKTENSKQKTENLKDMLYFVCNLCPFLCTNDSKITEHLENAHKNKTMIKLPELKCPACANVFYHRMSLRSHLIHDHGVGNSDLNQIIQAVIYYSTKNKAKEKKENKWKIKEDPDLKSVNEVLESEKSEQHCDYISQVDSFDNLAVENSNDTVHEEEQDSKIVILPQVDLIQDNPEKIFKSLMKQPESVTKYLETKKLSKCAIPTCKIQLQDNNKLNYHIDCHTEDGFKCNECDVKFLFWKPLTSHLWRIHKIDMDLYSCDKCEYKTFSLAKLNNIHKLIHSEVRGFSCDLCNKAFKNSKQLRNHKITHKDKTGKLTQHVCEECSKNFTDRRQLKVHMDVVHKKIRPYLCNYCAYKGSSRSSLKMHIRQHTGEKPFSCDSCSYTTSDHNSLRRHKLRHTGQNKWPYKCTYCSYACIQSSTYKTHLKTKHPGMEKDLMFTCHECQFRSVNKEMYSSHMITVHSVKPQLSN